MRVKFFGMKKSGIYIFVFQILFYAATTFIVHLLFFDFWSAPNSGSYLQNWLPVLIFDLIAGLVIGAANGLPWLIFGRGEGQTNKIFILTGAIWLVFCLWWYFNNRGSINREAAGHLISPFVFGFVGLVLAGLSFAYFLFRRRKV